MRDDANSLPDWQLAGQPYLWLPYTQMKTTPAPIPVVGAHGVYLELADGTELIDGLASWWSVCHGYHHQHIIAEASRQLLQLPHVMFGGINHPQASRLAERLAAFLPGDLNHIFFIDSGSVAVEVALKMAVQYWLNQSVTGRVKFVSFQHAYHGDTTGAMSVCDPVSSMHAHFKGFLLSQYPSPVPVTASEQADFERYLQRYESELAGVIIEPLIQGAGGMKFHPPEALHYLRQMCDRYGLLLIADEVATGFGRTGSWFACEQAQIVPDIMCIGKALTAGTVGMAATIATEKVFDAFWSDDPQHALMHGPTFMANPLACAAANASLDLFDINNNALSSSVEPCSPTPACPTTLAQIQYIENTLRSGLADCQNMHGVVDVRCRGGVGVIQVDELRQLLRLRQEFIKEGIWLRPFSDMIYMTPPLSITPAELTQLCERVVQVVHRWSKWH